MRSFVDIQLSNMAIGDFDCVSKHSPIYLHKLCILTLLTHVEERHEIAVRY